MNVEVGAIGGSATGTVSALNEATWCDIFPNVPPDVYKAKVVDIFIRLGKDRAVDHHLFQIKMYDYGRLALS